MNIKVLALDLDGTLTNSEKEITKRTKEALQQASEQGVAVVLASGRPTIGIRHIAKELELDRYGGYILAYNGGRIIDCSTNQDILMRVLPMEYFPQICDIAKEFDVAMLTYDGDLQGEKPSLRRQSAKRSCQHSPDVCRPKSALTIIR